jgi:type IV pilus assembly protein PilQ
MTWNCGLFVTVFALTFVQGLAQPGAGAKGIVGDSSKPPQSDVAVLPIQETVLPAGAADTTSLSFKDTDLRDIFRALSHEHGVNIFLDNTIAKRATISLNRVRVYDAIQFLVSENGLHLQVDGGIFKILPPPPPPKPEPPAPHIPLVGFEKGLLSLEFKDDPLEQVISEISKKTWKNVLSISGTTGTVTGKLTDVDFDIGFTQIMNNNGFAVQKRNGIYLVSRLEYFVGTQGTSSPQKTGPYWISVKDSLVTVDVTNAPLERVIPDMVRQLGRDVVFYSNLTGTVTARATSVPLARALDLVLRNTNYSYRESEGIFFVGEKTNKALTTTSLVRLKYLRADEAMDLIPQAITAQAAIKVSKEHNGFIVVGPHDAVQQLEEYFDQLDKPVAQVLIEALVVDYDVTKGTQFGIEAGLNGSSDTVGYNRSGAIYPGVDMSFNGTAVNHMLKQAGSMKIFGTEINLANLGTLPADFYLRLKWMESEGLANVKSRPLIATLNGHKASLSVGTTQYFLLKTTTPYRDQTQTVFQESQTFQTIEADVKLEITPYVGANGMITVDVKPDFRTPIGQFSPEVPPTISKRSMSSTLIMKEGETIVLGGLVQESESDVSTKVPILGDIPLLGKLFSSSSTSKRKAELLIYITPHVSYGEAFKTASVPEVE